MKDNVSLKETIRRFFGFSPVFTHKEIFFNAIKRDNPKIAFRPDIDVFLEKAYDDLKKNGKVEVNQFEGSVIDFRNTIKTSFPGASQVAQHKSESRAEMTHHHLSIDDVIERLGIKTTKAISNFQDAGNIERRNLSR